MCAHVVCRCECVCVCAFACVSMSVCVCVCVWSAQKERKKDINSFPLVVM